MRVELPAGGGTAGGFGQLGLRDTRFVTGEDGRPVRDDGGAVADARRRPGPGSSTPPTPASGASTPTPSRSRTPPTCSSAGPTGPGVFGDHATHLVRTDGGWLVATSTWGDFEAPTTRAGRRTPAGLRVTLAETDADLLRGAHVLDTRELPLPVDGLRLDRHVGPPPRPARRRVAGRLRQRAPVLRLPPGRRRRAGARRPAAAGRGDATVRRPRARRSSRSTAGWWCWPATGATPDAAAAPASRRTTSTMTETGALDAPYPTNLPWPTLAAGRRPVADGHLRRPPRGRQAARLRHPRRPRGDAVAVMRSGRSRGTTLEVTAVTTPRPR